MLVNAAVKKRTEMALLFDQLLCPSLKRQILWSCEAKTILSGLGSQWKVRKFGYEGQKRWSGGLETIWD